MFNKQYILVDKKPVLCPDINEWSKFQYSKSRILAKNSFINCEVSTVFLGLDHGDGHETPILFETLVFGGDNDGYMLRYTSWDDAISGHQEVCNLVDKVSIKRNNSLNDLGI